MKAIIRFVSTAAVSIPVLAGVASAQDMDFDDDCIAVIVDDTGDIVTTSGSSTTIDFALAAQRFYQTHGDDYDFLLIFPNFSSDHGSFHRIIFNDTTGLGTGRSDIDRRSQYGATDRLQSLCTFIDYTTYPNDPEARLAGNNDSTLSLLAQEIGHRWAAFARHMSGDDSLLGRSGSHWSYYHNAPGTGPRGGASSLEGNVWVDNGDGTFTTNSQTDGFSALDQYLMGLRASAAVPSFFFIQSPSGGNGAGPAGTPHTPPAAPDTVNGTRVNVSIGDIVAVNGSRDPSAARSQKNFRQAFILLAQSVPPQTDIDRLDTIRTAWEAYFAEETDFLGSVDTCILGRPLDIVFLLDISGSFADDLPILRANMPDLVDTILEASPGSRFALATFSDFPFKPYGNPDAGDYAYQLDLPLTSDSDAVIAAVDALEVLDALDLPQCQYEAIFQVMTGAGRDLAGNGNFTDLGDIAPTDIGADPDAPMFIFLFTDAPFHDPDVEPDYPFAGAVSAGRSDVLAELQNTPFVFGLVSGDDTAQIQELADLSGGGVFDLKDNSSGFEEAVVEAIETTDPPPADTLAPLAGLTINAAEINWETDEPGVGSIRLVGDVTLPEDMDHVLMNPVGATSIYVADADVAEQDVEFDTPNPNNWRSTTNFSQGFMMRIKWTSPTTGIYRLRAKFSPSDFAINGESGPMELSFVLSLGDEMLSSDVFVFEDQWSRANLQHWRFKQPGGWGMGGH